MKLSNPATSIITLALTCLLLSACATNRHYNAPQGGMSVFPNQPIWLPGTKQPELEYTQSFPQAEKSDHMEVVNAGLWIANINGKISQLIYEFTVNVAPDRTDTLYSRVILELPDAPLPITYHSELAAEAGSSKVTHAVSNVRLGESYQFIFELYHDEEMTNLFDRLEQRIIALAGNTSGCVELNPDYHRRSTTLLAAAAVKNIPVEKVVIACDQ